MATDPEITNRILAVIARTRRIPVESVTLEKTFEELNIDSLDGINLVFELESAFDIEVPDEAAREIRTVKDMVEGVARLIAQKNDLVLRPDPA
jgi:acyl carrier protein